MPAVPPLRASPAGAAAPALDPSPAGHSWILVTPALLAWAVTLVLVGCPPVAAVTVTALALTAALATAWHVRLRRWPWRTMTIAALACTAAASASVAFRVHALSSGPVSDLAARGATITAQVTLSDDPKIRRGPLNRQTVVVPATLDMYRTPGRRQSVRLPVLLLGHGPEWRPLLPSQRVEVTARLARPAPGELVGAVLLVRGPPRVLSPPSSLQAAAGTIRAALRSAADVLPADQRGLLPGLVVGDVSRLDPQIDADLQEAGLTHLNAVSGTNLSIVAGAALALSRLAGLPLAVRAVLAAMAMIGFAVVARPSPSVLRALLMGLVAAVALGTGRARDGVAALSAAVLLLIFFAPELARSYGFALSVAATAGILLLAPRWRDRLAGIPRDAAGLTIGVSRDAAGLTIGHVHPAPDSPAPGPRGLATSGRPRVRLPRWAAEAVAVPAAAQAAVTPVLVLMAGQLSLVAVPANLLAAPAVAPATLLGFAAALVAPFWPEAAEVLVVPAGYAVGWIIMVARWAVSVPLATVPWPGGVGGLVLLTLTSVAVLVVWRRRTWRTVTMAVAGGALVAVLAVRPITASWPPKGWLMVACDVGQGDGLVLAAGPGQAVVVDAGPDPVLMDRCLRRLRVTAVPLVILTHPHADHVAGLPGVFRGRRVGAVVMSPHDSAARRPSRLSADLSSLRVPQWPAVPGTRWRLGPSEVSVLAPDPVKGELGGRGEGSAINNSSVVVHVRWRAGSALLSGDIETEAQQDLLRGWLPRAEILKVPHHGSSRQDPAFFSAVRPRAALISVGAGNDYGHPAERTMAILHRLGVRVYRTDRSGDVAVVDRDGRLAVVTRGR